MNPHTDCKPCRGRGHAEHSTPLGAILVECGECDGTGYSPFARAMIRTAERHRANGDAGMASAVLALIEPSVWS